MVIFNEKHHQQVKLSLTADDACEKEQEVIESIVALIGNFQLNNPEGVEAGQRRWNSSTLFQGSKY